LFSCGPSLYRRPHIGNYRTFLYEDILQRYLEYLGYEVVRLISLTDIEDKTILESREKGLSLRDLVEKNRRIFSEDSELLKMRTPTYKACMMVCTSTAIEEAAKLIRKLLEKEYAYYFNHKGRLNVYFDPLKFQGFGKLSKLDMSNWPRKKRRFHRDTYPGTPWNQGDFILWHGYKEGDVDFWETEIGKGRPAWNIQDAATITKYLGSTIDVACGGIDNLTRHHDYTIAIVESASGKNLAPYWLHGQHLFVKGDKMSKSKGNVYYPEDLTKIGYTGEQIRFFLIYAHYRKRLNFTFEKLKNTSKKLDAFRNIIQDLGKARSKETSIRAMKLVNSLRQTFEKHMNRDLAVKDAFDSTFSIVSKLDILNKKGKLSHESACLTLSNLRRINDVLQVVF